MFVLCFLINFVGKGKEDLLVILMKINNNKIAYCSKGDSIKHQDTRITKKINLIEF
jgi:hypothetical protein